MKVHRFKQEVAAQRQKPQSHVTTSASMNTVQKSDPNIVMTSKEQILSNYPDIFKGIGRFPGLPYHIQVKPKHHTETNPVLTGAYSSQRSFQKRNRQDASSRYHQAS